MRHALALMVLLLVPVAAPEAQVSIQIGLPGISIGVNQPVYPQLVPVPGYPVYYDPTAGSNYFFYDGMYWVFQGDSWYASQWFNGPWALVAPQYVPVFILRVPVRYYRQPPPYFHGWVSEAPPRWGERWGHDWERHHQGWDRWDRTSVPPPAPLPTYQKQYVGNRYPSPERQQELRKQNYRYQPRDEQVRQVHQAYEQAPQKQPQGKQDRPPQQQQVQQQAPQRQPQQPQQREAQHQQQKAQTQQQAQPAPRPAPESGPSPQAAPPPSQRQGQGKQEQHASPGQGQGRPDHGGKPNEKGSDHEK